MFSRRGIDPGSGPRAYVLRWIPILPDGRLISPPIYQESEETCCDDLTPDRNGTYLDLTSELGYRYLNRTPCCREGNHA